MTDQLEDLSIQDIMDEILEIGEAVEHGRLRTLAAYMQDVVPKAMEACYIAGTLGHSAEDIKEAMSEDNG